VTWLLRDDKAMSLLTLPYQHYSECCCTGADENYGESSFGYINYSDYYLSVLEVT